MMRSSPDNESERETVKVEERERERAEGHIRGSFSERCSWTFLVILLSLIVWLILGHCRDSCVSHDCI